LQREAEQHKLAVAQQNMEERWLMRRHREIANQMVDEERHAAVANWAERRARVEEEIAHNVEAMRFQSDLCRRGELLPSDAHQDISATGSAGELQEQLQSRVSSRAAAAAAVGTSPQRQVPRYDVSRIEERSDAQQVRFAPEISVLARPNDPSKVDRIADLRRIHKHLLRTCDAEEGDFDDGDDDHVPESVFQTELSSQHISLSTYTPDCTRDAAPLRNKDAADVLAKVCDHWSQRSSLAEGEEGCGKDMHELRFKQQQEAEAVKRVLARRNCPFNAAVVDLALVMPSHLVKAEGYAFNVEPNLATSGLPNWYFEEQAKKKKTVKRGGRKATARGGTRRKTQR